MGARATRINREELLTPPEFRSSPPDPGTRRHASAGRVELVRSGAETRLGTCYQQVPVRLMPPFVLDSEPACLLYLINLTAGLLDGDGHKIEITAREGTRAVVTGQSATRIHPAQNHFATQQWNIEVEDDACLVLLPGPAIPYRGSRYFQRARVELAPRAQLIWGDIWLAGRYDRGELSERFQFERIVQDFEARRAGTLVYRDRFRWDGPWTPDDARWYFGDALASASSSSAAGPEPDVSSWRRYCHSVDRTFGSTSVCAASMRLAGGLARSPSRGTWSSPAAAPGGALDDRGQDAPHGS